MRGWHDTSKRRPIQVMRLLSRHLRGRHSRQNNRSLVGQAGRVAVAVVEARTRHHTGQSCRLLGAKLRGADAVVVPRRRFGAEYAVAPFDDVEIDLENALLAPDGVRKRFLASCWEMVEPPATIFPRRWFFSMAFWIPPQSNPS